MNDEQILEVLTAKYGSRLEDLSMFQKYALITLATINYADAGILPDDLITLVRLLSQDGVLSLIESVVPQIRASREKATTTNHSIKLPPTSGPIRVTVLYPMSSYPHLDDLISGDANACGGRFIGSGTDGDQRDLVFDFPDALYILSFKTALFLARCLNLPDCELMISRLDATDRVLLNDTAAESRAGLVNPTGGRS